MNVIEISDVSFRVGSKILLENIDLTVRKGEFLGLLGPNGAGKSTLLNLMNSSLHPGTGELRIFGETPSSPGGAGIWEICRRIAFVPQSLDFNPAVPLTAREVVEMARSGRRGPLHALTPEDHDIARSSMERLGVLNLAKRTYRSLSGGERQKVQLARALAWPRSRISSSWTSRPWDSTWIGRNAWSRLSGSCFRIWGSRSV